MRNQRVDGLDKLMKDIKKLEKMPQKQIAKGVRRGAKVILLEARARAPKGKTGKLRKKLTLKSGRSKKRGKKVMQIIFQKVDKFQEAVKITKDGTRYYYPSAQNFGFKTNKKHGKYGSKDRVEGKHFLEGAMASKQGEAARVMIDEIGKEIEKSLQEGTII